MSTVLERCAALSKTTNLMRKALLFADPAHHANDIVAAIAVGAGALDQCEIGPDDPAVIHEHRRELAHAVESLRLQIAPAG
jgi:hypothetical protein